LVLAGNFITGKLSSCSGNQPAPIDRGVPNAVTGKATGAMCLDRRLREQPPR
jgi:hypothetical protein